VIALYDNNKNFLSSVSVRGTGLGNKLYEVDLTNSEFNGAAYAVASSYLHYEESTFLAYNSLSPYGNEEKESYVMYDYPNGFDLQGFWNASGAFEGNENVKSSSLLDVRGYSVLRAVGCLNNSGYVVALFDKDKNIIPGLSVLGDAVLSAKEVTIDLKDVAYSSVCYASVAVYYYDLYIDSCYIECVSEKFVEESASELFGKTFNVLGDSISSVDYVNPNWWQMIANKTFARFNNYAVSGTPIARGNRSNSFVERVTDLNVNADGVIVMGGTNDGDTYKGAWDSTDDTTFYGALNYLLTQLSTNFSGKPILFCTPIQPKTGYGENTNNPLETLNAKSENEKLTPQERAEAIKLKCKQYGIPCVDLYNESGLNGVTGVYYIDDLHPSQTGHERMSSLIRSKLEEVFR
jgi:lysophospholipase L1-like esterase